MKIPELTKLAEKLPFIPVGPRPKYDEPQVQRPLDTLREDFCENRALTWRHNTLLGSSMNTILLDPAEDILSIVDFRCREYPSTDPRIQNGGLLIHEFDGWDPALAWYKFLEMQCPWAKIRVGFIVRFSDDVELFLPFHPWLHRMARKAIGGNKSRNNRYGIGKCAFPPFLWLQSLERFEGWIKNGTEYIFS